MDTSYLSQQVNTIIGQLHGLFNEIGVSDNEREARETEVRKSEQAVNQSTFMDMSPANSPNCTQA